MGPPILTEPPSVLGGAHPAFDSENTEFRGLSAGA